MFHFFLCIFGIVMKATDPNVLMRVTLGFRLNHSLKGVLSFLLTVRLRMYAAHCIASLYNSSGRPLPMSIVLAHLTSVLISCSALPLDLGVYDAENSYLIPHS